MKPVPETMTYEWAHYIYTFQWNFVKNSCILIQENAHILFIKNAFQNVLCIFPTLAQMDNVFTKQIKIPDDIFVVVAKEPWGRLNKKDGLTRYGNSHVKDKTS